MNRLHLSVLGLAFVVACGGGTSVPITPTVAQIERVRAGVTLAEPSRPGARVDEVRRVVPGTLATTDGSGRALVVLDHGERFLLDGDSGVRVTDGARASLERGRLWVVGSSRVDLQACKLEYSIVSPK